MDRQKDTDKRTYRQKDIQSNTNTSKEPNRQTNRKRKKEREREYTGTHTVDVNVYISHALHSRLTAEDVDSTSVRSIPIKIHKRASEPVNIR